MFEPFANEGSLRSIASTTRLVFAGPALARDEQ
jgi:hypothetical protein